ncbi:MAG: AsmA family protein [Desulfuromonadales bacterium]|nr:AsmA family protein [Desulfuromonadales bacterium]MDT8423639.1 AsmA family protein [Desulfuromonadales bacterium]
MRKLRKIVLLCLAALSAVVFGSLLLVYLLITPERVRETLVPLAENELGREVSLGEIDISLWSGIRLRELKVAEADGKNTFLSIDELVLRYRFWPLLRLRVVVDEARLSGARVSLIKLPDGAFNFSSLVKSSAEGTAPKEEKLPGQGTDSSDNSFDLQIATIALNNCALNYEDRSTGVAQAPLKVDQFNLLIHDFSLTEAFNFKADTKVNGESVAVQGEMSLKKPGISMSSLLQVRDQQVDLTLKIHDLQSQPLQVDWQASAATLDLDRLLQSAATTSNETPSQRATATAVPAAEEIGPFDLPLRMQGKVKISKIQRQQIVMTDFVSKVNLINNVFTLETLTARVAEGGVSAQASIDLGRKGLAYTPSFTVDKVQAASFVTMFYPALTGMVNGSLSLSAQLFATGTQLDTMKKTLSGDGKFALNDGQLTGTALINGLAEMIGEERLKTLECDDFSGNFKIDNGKVNITSSYRGSDLEMTPLGSIGLDESIALRLDTRVSPAVMSKIGRKNTLGRLLSDDRGWGIVPLRISGTLTDPRFKLDSKGAREQLKRQATEKILEKLDEKLDKKLGGDGGQGSASRTRIKNTLKDLFGN